MSTFKFSEVVNSPLALIITAALGASAGATLTTKDIGKTLKLNADSTYAPCAEGDHIEGFLSSVNSDGTVNSGYNLGGVQRNREVEVVVAVGSATCTLGSLVVAGAPLAVGTEGKGRVKKQTIPTDAATLVSAYGKPVWRVCAILSGTGVAGDRVLIEKV